MEKTIKKIFKNEYKSSATYGSNLSIYCKKLAQKYNFKYNGIFSRNEIAVIPKINKSFSIINFDLSHNSGTHWVGIIQHNDFVYYFDSYGGHPLKEVMKLFKPQFKILFNNYALQMRNTAICGDLVIVFFQFMFQYKPSRETYYKLLEILSKHSNRVRIDERGSER